MSSIEVNLISISLKQYFYKLKAYTTLVNRLIITQILALFLSLVAGSGAMFSTSNGELSFSMKTYSASTVIVFSFLWIVIVAILLTTKQYKRIEIPLIVNRISGSLSDVGFLLTASVFAGITSSLAGVFLRVIMYFTFDRSKIAFDGFSLPFSDLLLGLVVAILYMILISAMGYFIGMLAQLNMAFVILVPVVIYETLRVYTNFSLAVVNFFVSEVSLPLFALKVISLTIVLFGASLFLSNRMEVGK